MWNLRRKNRTSSGRGIFGVLRAAVIVTGILFAAVGLPAHAQQPTKVKVGFLHTVAVDEVLLVGQQLGFWKAEGIEFEMIQFNSGVPLAQALAGGSIDVGIMGSVLSNFPSRGQGIVFLANNIEAKSVLFYASPASGIRSITDLKGKQVALVKGAAGQVVLQVALRKAGMTMNDVEIVNSDMATAVNAFISGSVPALVTWLPFNVLIEKQKADSVLFATGDRYYGPRQGLLGGWVASNQFHRNRRDVLVRLARAWLKANEYVLANPQETVKILKSTTYGTVAEEQLLQMHNAAQLFGNDEWAAMYRDGKVAELIGATQQVFIDIGAFSNFVEPTKFFDASIFLEAYDASKKPK